MMKVLYITPSVYTSDFFKSQFCQVLYLITVDEYLFLCWTIVSNFDHTLNSSPHVKGDVIIRLLHYFITFNGLSCDGSLKLLFLLVIVIQKWELSI